MISRRKLLTSAVLGLVTPAKAQFLSSANSGPSYSPEALSLFARLPDQPSTAEKARYDTLLRALVTSGVYAKLDALHILKCVTSAANGLQNVIQDAYNCTIGGSPTWTSDQGYKCNSTGDFLNTGFNPVTAVSPKFTQNDSCIGAWSLYPKITLGSIMGQTGGSGWIYIAPRLLANTADIRCCGLSTGLDARRDGSGLFMASRVGTAIKEYEFNVVLGSGTSTSQAPHSSNFVYLRERADYYVNGTIAAGWFGAALDDAQQLSLYNALDMFMWDGYDVFMIAGQSNCYSGEVLDDAVDTQNGYADQWFTNHPLGGNEAIQQNGTTLSITNIGFAVAMMREIYGPEVLGIRRKALLVGCALGSTAMTRWIPSGDLYADAVTKVNAAMACRAGNRMAGIFFQQGEADDGRTEAAYSADIDSMVAGFRGALTGGTNTPYLCGGLGDDFLAAHPSALPIQASIENAPNRIAHCAFVSAVGLAQVGNIHFTAAAQRLFGPRYGNALISML